MSFLVTAAATATTSAIVGGATATTVGAALAGGTAASVGAGIAGAAAGAATAGALGAGVGAISSAAQGQDVGKGALMGAASGVVTAGVAGGVSAALGPAAVGGTQAALQGVAQGVGNVAAGAAGGATGAAVGGNDVGKGALVGAGTAAAAQVASGLVGGIGSSVGAPDTTITLGPGAPAGAPVPTTTGATGVGGAGVTTNTLPSLGKIDPGVPMEGNLAANAPGAPPAPATSMLDPTAKFLSQSGTPITAQGIKGTLGGLGGAVAGDYAGQGIIDAQDATDKAASEDKARGLDFASQGSSGLAGVRAAGLPDGSGPLGSLGRIGKATGGITALAHGGQVPLGDGAYIIPADVVSALGNGSSKAGADYLRRLMIEVRKEAVNLQGMGAAKKHVS